VPDSSVVQQPVPALRLPDELLEKSGFVMVRLALEFKAHALEALEEFGFSQYHYSVLAMLREQPRKAQSMIAEALRVDPSQLVGVLDALEDKGLIVRQRDPDDRRRHVVSLTAEGGKKLTRLRTTIDRLEDEFLAPLDAASRSTFHDLLLRLAAHHDPGCYPGPCA
jgi:DNA-binding MarR family transcriptional regulator